jgi:hypothetical protein
LKNIWLMSRWVCSSSLARTCHFACVISRCCLLVHPLILCASHISKSQCHIVFLSSWYDLWFHIALCGVTVFLEIPANRTLVVI